MIAGKLVACIDEPEQHVLWLDVVIDALGLVGKVLDALPLCNAVV